MLEVSRESGALRKEEEFHEVVCMDENDSSKVSQPVSVAGPQTPRPESMFPNAGASVNGANYYKTTPVEQAPVQRPVAAPQYQPQYPSEDEYIRRLDLMAREREERKAKKPSILPRLIGWVFLAMFVGAVAGGTYFTLEHFFFPEKLAQTRETAEKTEPRKEPTKPGDQPFSIAQTDDLSGLNLTPVSAIDVSSVADSVMPAVVAINNYVTETSFDIWSGKNVISEELKGSGSGIIIGQNSEEVLIVTNYHVVSGASRLSIEFCDKTVTDAKIKGTASSTDLAVVAVPFSQLSASTVSKIRVARIGDSDSVKVGEIAIAIGNALGYGQSVTVGYVSALNRDINVDGKTLCLIQTDAAINPGNSGGALLNKNGEVIAINSAKYSDYSVEGMGFAIPITNVRDIIEELSSREILPDEERGYLGIVGSRDITDSYSQMLGLPKGVYVQEIAAGSPAIEGGLLSGDVILKIDRENITSIDDIRTFLNYTRAGTEITMTVARRTRNGMYNEIKLHITLGHYPDEPQPVTEEDIPQD